MSEQANGISLGVALWSQASTGRSSSRPHDGPTSLGFDHVQTWDHVYAIFGDRHQPIFEGYTALAALAQATERTRLGLFVGANTFRNPALVAKSMVTIDHISGGRAVLGIGGAWFETRAPGVRVRFRVGLRPAARLARQKRCRQSAPCSTAARSRARTAVAMPSITCSIAPRPVQAHLPMMIGGGGEREDTPDRRRLRRHLERLRHARHRRPQGRGPARPLRRPRARLRHDRAVGWLQGRDPLDEGRGPGTLRGDRPAQPHPAGTPRRRRDLVGGHAARRSRDTMLSYRAVGFHTFLCETPAPYDAETMESLISVVKPHGRSQPGSPA